MRKQTHALYMLTTDTLAHCKETHDLHVIVPSKPYAYFCGVRSWPSQNNGIPNLNVFGCAQVCFWWMYKTLFCLSQNKYTFHALHFNTHENNLYDSAGQMRPLKCRRGSCLFAAISFSLEDYFSRLLQTPSDNPKQTHLYHRVDSHCQLLGQGPRTCAYQSVL